MKVSGKYDMGIEDIGRVIIDSTITVHKELGPGLLESTYQTCMEYELKKRGLSVACEILLPIRYGECKIESAYRIDMLVEDCVIIENKAMECILPIHEAQLLTYLKLRECWLGYLLNWNVVRMKDGIKRMVNGPKPAI